MAKEFGKHAAATNLLKIVTHDIFSVNRLQELSASSSIDHLVGAPQQDARHVETERLGGP